MDQNLNLLTVDLEEWFVVDVLSNRFVFEDWDNLPSTVTENSYRLLDLFRRYNTTATWFVLGWCAQKYPQLIQKIFNQGHEIACHSYRHLPVNRMGPSSFRKDTELAIEAIVKAIGARPVGYRAPSWSIDATIPWAFEVLAELGFEYDSSIFPIKHDIFGMPSGPRHCFKIQLANSLSLYEIPATTYRIFGHNIPIAGGGFLRHAPYWYSSSIIRKINRKGRPVMVYIHPWEIDSNPPPVKDLSFLQRYRSYGATSIMNYKLEKLMRDFSFTTMYDYIRLQEKRRIGFH